MEEVLRLKWFVHTAGYELRSLPEEPNKLLTLERKAGEYIVPRGKRIEVYEMGLRGEDIFVELANASNREGALRFVNNWGLLLDPQYPEDLDGFLHVAREMANTLPSASTAFFKGRQYPPLNVQVDGRQMILRPTNLQEHCWLQRLHAH